MKANSPKPKHSSSSQEETRIVILSPESRLTPEIITKEIVSLPIIVKTTCWGLILSGDPETVQTAVERVRKLDPHNIFSKIRGYPPGDPRICRFHRGGGARPGFHLLEYEATILPHITKALGSPTPVSAPAPKKKPLPIKKLKKILAELEE